MTKGEVMIYAACYGAAYAGGADPENAAQEASQAVAHSRRRAENDEDGYLKRLLQVLDYDG